MTEKVFYQDSYRKTHHSEVLEVVPGGLILAATIFYPQGGGVVLGDELARDRVVDTRYAEDRERIVHCLDGEDTGGIKAGDEVDMEIDWQRRHRLMRMHTSMHLICSLIDR